MGAFAMAVALSVEMLLFSSLFLLPISVISQNNGRVAVGSSLTATTGDSSSWLSPSFHPVISRLDFRPSVTTPWLHLGDQF
ncbi:hypothetical protein ACFX15_035281 [Malus domestica]